MIILRQSTASQEIPLGYFLDSTDGNTEETGLTIANTDIKLWKHGATALANKNSGGGTHISNGIFYAVLDATDTNTIGNLVVFVHVAGALAIKVNCVVLDEAVYDVVFGTTAPSTLDAPAVRAAVGLASANLDTQLAAIDNYVDTEVAAIKTVTDKLDTALELDGAVYRYTVNALEQAPTGGSAPTAAAIADAVWDEDPAGHTTPGTYGELIPNMETDVDTLRGDLENNRSEPGQGALPASTSILAKIDYLFKFLRNKKDNDGTNNRLYADDGTTVDHKQTTDVSGGTVTKGEWVSGP